MRPQRAEELEQLMELDQLPDLCALIQLLAPLKRQVPQVLVTRPTSGSYGELFVAGL